MKQTITPRARKTKNGYSIYLDKYVNGKRSYETIFKNVTKKDKNQKLVEAEKIIKQILKNYNSYTLFEFLDEYKNNYIQKDIRVINAVVTKFKEFMGHDILISDLGNTHVKDFRYYLKERANLKGETPSSYSIRFKKILQYLYENEMINRNTFNSFKIISIFNNKPKDVLTFKELSDLKKHKVKNEQIKMAFIFCCLSGLGYAEIKKLNWEHIQGRNLRIKREKTSNYIDIQLSDLAIELLGSEKNKGLVFNLINEKIGDFYSSETVNRMLSIWMKELNINKKITFYCARHCFANFLFEQSYNSKNYHGLFYVVSKAMGHCSQKSTYRYLNNYRNDVYSLTNNLGVC